MNEKLELLSGEQILELVGGYLRQSDPARDEPLPVPEDVRAALAAARDPKEARQKIAKYVLRDHPLAVRRTLETRMSAALPALEVGVARIVTLTAGADTASLTVGEQTVLRNVPRLAVAWNVLIGERLDDLAQGLGLQPESLLVSGRAYDVAARGPDIDDKPPALDLAAILHVLRELIAGASSHAEGEPRTVQALWAYKLGLEVMLPRSRNEVARKNELLLQQELCRFLVERDVPAYGMSFGPAQVDLRAEDAFGTLILETKIERKGLSETRLRAILAQLLSYMDQAPIKHRGALLVYNLTDVPVVADRRKAPVNGKLHVVPVNLCDRTPSKRTDVIELVASDDPKVIIHFRQPLRRGTGSDGR